jgi:hypothetical protein
MPRNERQRWPNANATPAERAKGAGRRGGNKKRSDFAGMTRHDEADAAAGGLRGTTSLDVST